MTVAAVRAGGEPSGVEGPVQAVKPAYGTDEACGYHASVRSMRIGVTNSTNRRAAPTLPLRSLPIRLLLLVASLFPMPIVARESRTPFSATLPALERLGEPIMLSDWRCMCMEADTRALDMPALKGATGDADNPAEERLRRIRGRS